MNTDHPRVLIVEDNADLAFGLQLNLSQEGYDTRVAQDGTEAFTTAREWPPDVVILDLILPGMNGLELLRQWRSSGHDLRIIILSGKAEEVDVVNGLRTGADDYVTKPFSLLELLERVRKQVDLSSFSRRVRNRTGRPAARTEWRPSRDYEAGDEGDLSSLKPACSVLFKADHVIVNGRSVRLTPTEMSIFRALADARVEGVLRSDLVALTGGAGPKSLALNKHMHRIRTKIAAVGGGTIVGLRGRYVWFAPPR